MMAPPDPARCRGRADGAGAAGRRGSVRGTTAPPVPALHPAVEAVADGDAGDIDDLVRLEEVARQLLAGLPLPVREPELPHVAEGARPRLLELAELGLVEGFLFHRLESELDRAVPVALLLAQAEDRARAGLDGGHRQPASVVVVDVRHSKFFTEQTNRH